ncbi:MAG: class I SAM-dependent rRNA methyltransferase, partial [Muribaculaceae bacterium]|nr:class I SAM-dependent rRNA methyltransferase [Muribaculaceae bacterium]
MIKEIKLKRGKEESLDRFHPWVFSGAIASLPKDIEEGEVAKVFAADGRLIGVGHYQIGSIAVRILDFSDRRINKEFFKERLSEALNLRLALGLMRDDNNAFRLVHGEGDFLPGLVIDIYGNTAVLQAHSPGMHFERNTIAMALTELDGISIRNVYYKSETTLPYKASLDPVNDYIIGGFETNLATENGLQFYVDWLKGQKTGFFVDQRENRALL